MKQWKLRLAGCAVLLGAVALCSGCQVTGGGFIPSLAPGQTATFALNGTYSDTSPQVSGQGDYHDQAVGVNAHLVVTSPDVANISEGQVYEFLNYVYEYCSPPNGPGAPFVGTYQPQPANAGPGGSFIAVAINGGQPNSGQDFLAIAFIGGIYDGYFNCGPVLGGNIQTHP